MLYLELLIQGLIYGSMYAIIAVGLTLVYGLLRILHVAHAGLFDPAEGRGSFRALRP